MYLQMTDMLTFLSARHGDRKTGGSWYSIVAYDNRGNTYNLYFSENVRPNAIDALQYIRLGDKILITLEAYPAREGRFSLRVYDLEVCDN